MRVRCAELLAFLGTLKGTVDLNEDSSHKS